jgi:N-acyl-L-homoserine lactone synthetase
MNNFTFLEVTDKELLDKVYAFRYKVFMEIYPEYMRKLDLEETREEDEYDSYAVHFAALNAEREVCATMRIIYNSPIGYPVENNVKFDNSMFARDKLGETSRIFIDARYRGMKTGKLIINEFKKLMYRKMIDIGVEYTYGYLEESFLRLLQIYKTPYKTIGEKQEHVEFGARYPCIMYRDELAEKNPEFIKFGEQ